MRYDFRGFGATEPATGPHNDADDVVAVLDKFGIERTAVIGASYGGGVAQEIAARWPARVASLALVCPGPPGEEPSGPLTEFWQREEELIEAGDIDGAVELNVSTWLGPEATAATRDQVRQMQRHAFEVQLGAGPEPEAIQHSFELSAITAPSLIISGAKDLPDFRMTAARLAAALAGARSVELAWAGHLPTMERPGELSGLLIEYLRETVPT